MDGIQPLPGPYGDSFESKKALPPLPVVACIADLTSASNLSSYMASTLHPWIAQNIASYPLEKSKEINKAFEDLSSICASNSYSISGSIETLSHLYSLLGDPMSEESTLKLSRAAQGAMAQNAQRALFGFYQATAEPLTSLMPYLTSADPKVQSAAVDAISTVQKSRKSFEEKIDSFDQSLAATPPAKGGGGLSPLEEILTVITQDMQKVAAELSQQMQSILSMVAATEGASEVGSTTASGNVNNQYFAAMSYMYQVLCWFGGEGGTLFSNNPAPLALQLFMNAVKNLSSYFGATCPSAQTDPIGNKIYFALNDDMNCTNGQSLVDLCSSFSTLSSNWQDVLTGPGSVGIGTNVMQNLYTFIVGPGNWFDHNGVNPFYSYNMESPSGPMSSVYQDLNNVENDLASAQAAWQRYISGWYGTAAWNGGTYTTGGGEHLNLNTSQGVVQQLNQLAAAIKKLQGDLSTALTSLKGQSPPVYDGYLEFLNNLLDTSAGGLDSIVQLASSMIGKVNNGNIASPKMLWPRIPPSQYASKLSAYPFLQALLGIAVGSNTPGVAANQFNILYFLGGENGIIATILGADFKG